MLIVETVVRIRLEHAAGKAIKAIARDLRLSRKVVRKAIRSPEAAFNYQRKVQPLPRIGPYQDRLDALLEENEGRGRRDRLRMTRIHDLLVREGFDGSYDARSEEHTSELQSLMRISYAVFCLKKKKKS